MKDGAALLDGMKDGVALLMEMGYTFHQAVSMENAWLWADLQKEKEKEKEAK